MTFGERLNHLLNNVVRDIFIRFMANYPLQYFHITLDLVVRLFASIIIHQEFSQLVVRTYDFQISESVQTILLKNNIFIHLIFSGGHISTRHRNCHILPKFTNNS